MTSPIRRNRFRRAAPRLAAFALAIGAAGGCSSGNQLDWELAYHAVLSRLDTSQSPGVTLQQASAIPYASMGVRVGDGPEALIVLAGDESGISLWTSSSHVAVETRGGRIVRTGGLPFNLASTSFPVADPLETILTRSGAVHYTRLVDFPDQSLYSVVLDCDMVSAGKESITILGQQIPTERVEEHCRAEKLDWDFTNRFWIGQSSGFVWRSLQFVHPKLAGIETEILRPPG